MLRGLQLTVYGNVSCMNTLGYQDLRTSDETSDRAQVNAEETGQLSDAGGAGLYNKEIFVRVNRFYRVQQ